ncbi:MAG: putative toxin-antitoxin system toxin component, PIN family [Bacteroidales bacterium]|nr:putative toxin-antitoxin system toxin component, PIN family [Bacteroidales bacterium]MBR4488123.1 putative toxin-antitoxin system toxin component, PIN family [Bacteroidales bacterium]
MEKSSIYAVIDTNVVVSALLSIDSNSNPAIVLRAVLQGRIIPVFNEEILDEYMKVLLRDKFHFNKSYIDIIISHIKRIGLKAERVKILDEIFPDTKDIVFYEVAMSKDDTYLVTGNTKHFPKKPFVVTPAEMVEILNS